MHSHLRILISAYACEPDKGSEPGVGWEYAKHLAGLGEVWVVTRSNNQDVIDNELSKHPVKNLHVVFIDLPKWTYFWKAGLRGMHLYYSLWQILLFKKARELHGIYHFDIFHHLTFGNMWLPVFAPLVNIPFIWGPVGGGEKISMAFIKHHSVTTKLKEYLRTSIIGTLRFNPFFRFCCRKAKAIVVKTEHTAKLIPDFHKGKVIQMTDVGISMSLDGNRIQGENTPIRIICVGSLVYWRGFDIAIKAFAKVQSELDKAVLTIVGDGPDRNRLKRIADEEGVLDKVTFMGNISKDMLNQEMDSSTIYLHSCLKEGGVTVLLDALQRGMPVICMDTGGVTKMVNDIKIPLLHPEHAVSMIAEALVKLAKDAGFREKVGRASRASVESFTWEEKARVLYGIYTQKASAI